MTLCEIVQKFDLNCKCVFNGPNPAAFCLFSLFSTTILQKNNRHQWDSNSDCRLEGKLPDHLTITTAYILCTFSPGCVLGVFIDIFCNDCSRVQKHESKGSKCSLFNLFQTQLIFYNRVHRMYLQGLNRYLQAVDLEHEQLSIHLLIF